MKSPLTESMNRLSAAIAWSEAKKRRDRALELAQLYCKRLAAAYWAPVEDVEMVDGEVVDEFRAAESEMSSAELKHMFNDPNAGKGPEHFSWGDYP